MWPHAGVLPANESFRVLYNDGFILFQHRHQNSFQLALPKFALIEFRFHRLEGSEIGKAAHEEEDVRIFRRKNGPNIFIPISSCAGMDFARNTSTNRARIPGLVL